MLLSILIDSLDIFFVEIIMNVFEENNDIYLYIYVRGI